MFRATGTGTLWISPREPYNTSVMFHLDKDTDKNALCDLLEARNDVEIRDYPDHKPPFFVINIGDSSLEIQVFS